jgi:hypothetical protein
MLWWLGRCRPSQKTFPLRWPCLKTPIDPLEFFCYIAWLPRFNYFRFTTAILVFQGLDYVRHDRKHFCWDGVVEKIHLVVEIFQISSLVADL